jgi:uncharacterized protein (TIGR00255 family)
MTQTKNRVVRSMTGQGHATEQGELGTVVVEMRTVNSRGFKCSPRLSDSLSSLEHKVETLVRSAIHRGTVHITVSLRRPPGENLPNIDTDALQSYLQKLREIRSSNEDVAGEIDLSSLLTLPGVINSNREDRRNDQGLWAFIAGAISNAIENLDQMRAVEGQRMADTLSGDCSQIVTRLSKIEQVAPRAVDVYRNRLQGKIERILGDHGLEVPAVDLLRELQVYADRVDISEEIVRLGSHLTMFESVLQGGDEREPTGRKLDFILQEMFRETNTIGSKAADVELSAHVVEIKCAIERMRELVQNLE